MAKEYWAKKLAIRVRPAARRAPTRIDVAIGGDADVIRAEGISEMLSFGVLALASALIYIRSWRQVSPDLGPAA